MLFSVRWLVGVPLVLSLCQKACGLNLCFGLLTRCICVVCIEMLGILSVVNMQIIDILEAKLYASVMGEFFLINQ